MKYVETPERALSGPVLSNQVLFNLLNRRVERELLPWAPAQVSLAWLIRKPNVVAIPGASSVHQLEENVAACDIALSDEESARLDSLSA